MMKKRGKSVNLVTEDFEKHHLKTQYYHTMETIRKLHQVQIFANPCRKCQLMSAHVAII